MRRRSVGYLAVSATLLTLAACNTSGAATGAATSAPPVPTSVAAGPAPTLAPAADGDDLSACQDGTCEVRIDGPTSIPVDPRYAVANLRVTTITDTTATITADLTRAGAVRSDCGQTGASCGTGGGKVQMKGATDTQPASVKIDAAERYTTHLPALTIVPVDVLNGAAVLRLSHPEAGDGTDVSTCRDGTCAVKIDRPASIPLEPATGVRGDMRVREISADSVTLSLTPEGSPRVTIACGPVSADVCDTTYTKSVLRTTLVRGAELRLPELTVRLSALDDGAAVLELFKR